MSQTQGKSLTQLGFKIEPMKNAKDGFVARVRGKAPVFYLKQTRSGALRAYRNREDKFETTISGLYNFEHKDGDVIGAPAVVGSKQPQSTKKESQSEKQAA